MGLPMSSSREDNQFIFPSTSPIDFEPEEALKAVDMIVATGAERAYLTHFGCITDLKKCGDKLKYGIHQHEYVRNKLVWEYEERTANNQSFTDEDMDRIAKRLVRSYFKEELRKHSLPTNSKDLDTLLAMDMKLNAEGIVVAAKRQIKALQK